MEQNQILNKNEVAMLLGVKTRSITHLTTTRQIPFIKGLGREYRYLRDSIMEWLKQKEIKPENSFIEP